MPRNRPGAVRAIQQGATNPIRQWAYDPGPINRMSPATSAAIRVVEYGGCLNQDIQNWAWYDIRPGRTVGLLRKYHDFLRQPGRTLRLVASGCPSCPSCQYEDVAVVRDALDVVTRALPPSACAEMRRLLIRLDHEFRRRTLPDSNPKASWNGEPLPWWHHRIYRN